MFATLCLISQHWVVLGDIGSNWVDIGGGAGCPAGYRPGGYLTDWTGSIPDTVNDGGCGLEKAHAMENEQCDGRETAVCL